MCRPRIIWPSLAAAAQPSHSAVQILDADLYGIEHVDIGEIDIMSYRGRRPICAICQLNVDAISAVDEGDVLNHVIEEMKVRREHLWPHDKAE